MASLLTRIATSNGSLAPIYRIPARNSTKVLSGPPRVKISFAEKIICGVILFTALTGPGAYVLANIQNYRARPETGGAEE